MGGKQWGPGAAVEGRLEWEGHTHLQACTSGSICFPHSDTPRPLYSLLPKHSLQHRLACEGGMHHNKLRILTAELQQRSVPDGLSWTLTLQSPTPPHSSAPSLTHKHTRATTTTTVHCHPVIHCPRQSHSTMEFMVGWSRRRKLVFLGASVMVLICIAAYFASMLPGEVATLVICLMYFSIRILD